MYVLKALLTSAKIAAFWQSVPFLSNVWNKAIVGVFRTSMDAQRREVARGRVAVA